MDVFNIVVGIVGIIAFIFSVWIWMRSDIKIRELSKTLSSIHDIAGTAVLESQMTISEDYDFALRQAQRTSGYISSIRKLTAQYASGKVRIGSESDIHLLEHEILWTMGMIWDVEASDQVKEIWMVTPDLKPDASEEYTGRLVNKNIRRGKRYIYFYPDDLPHADSEIARLFKNVGATESRTEQLRARITLVPLSRVKYAHLFYGGNIILYYRDAQRLLLPRCFEEVTLTKVPERGAFWQEHSDRRATELRHLLADELKSYLDSQAVVVPPSEPGAA